MKTWNYHKSNASIGDPVVLYGLGPLGNSIKAGMLGNAAIGVGVNTAIQLSGKDPFNYVDTILAGVTAAVTTGKGVGVSAGINMGGAALGSAVNGDNPIRAVIGAGVGSLIGSGTSKLVTEGMSTTAKEGTKELVSAVSGSAASEVVSEVVKDGINAAEKKDDKK